LLLVVVDMVLVEVGMVLLVLVEGVVWGALAVA